MWKYGKETGELPVYSGTLSVLPTGRIEGFTVSSALADTLVASIKKALPSIKADMKTVTMKASTVLPNTVDEAFTVAFSLEGLGLDTSLATGMFVTKSDVGVEVKGDITLDPKTLGFVDSKESLTLSPIYVFKQ
jgi:hypothetical protein